MFTSGGRNLAQGARAACVPTALWLIAAASAGAATHLVRPDGAGDFPTIQAAVDAVAEGDTIALADGTFRGDGNRDVTFGGKDVVVRSQSGQAALCVIDCQGTEEEPHRGFEFCSWESPAAIVEGLTIRNGYGPDNPYDTSEGGAVRCYFALPTLQDCVFTNNRADRGAAIMLTGPSAPLIRRCTFTGNHAFLDAAGIHCMDTSAPLVCDCLFQENTAASRAGGVFADYYASPVFSGCTFTDNHAGSGGGGAAACGSADPLFRRCTFVGNSADANGAGLSLSCSADAFLEGCIIAFNTVGPAVTALNQSTATLSCCDLFGNAGGDWVGPIASQQGLNGNFSADPLFCDLPAGNLRINGSSPCLPRNHPQGAECGVIGAWGVGCPATGVDPLAAPPARLRLASPWPNPSTGRVEFRFDLPVETAGARPVEAAGTWPVEAAGTWPVEAAGTWPPATASFRVHDAAGRLVTMLLQRPLEPGAHVIRWDGRDLSGRPAPAGAYFARLRYGDETAVRAFLLAR